MNGLDKYIDKIRNIAVKIQKNDVLMSISSGLQACLPVIIIGAFSSLLANFPIDAWKTYVAETGIKSFLALPNQMTTNIISVYAVFLIAYKLAKKKGHDGIQVGIVSLMSFLVLNGYVVLEKTSALTFEYLGAAGLFTAMFVAVVVNFIFSLFKKYNLYMKLPDEVPDQVGKVFSSLIQAIACAILFGFLSFGIAQTSYGTLSKMMYTLLQEPLQGIAGSFGGMLVFIFISQVLWFFGIHGTQVTGAVWKPIYLAMDMANLAAFNAGTPMTELPYIVGWAFWGVFVTLGGTGATAGLNILMAFKSKSKQMKTIGKLTLPTTLLNINEPLVFGTPLVLNAFTVIPFIFVPMINAIIGYVLTAVNILPRMIGITPVLGVPVIVRGLLEGSIAFGIASAAFIVLDGILYYPFFKAMDNNAFREEEKKEQEQ